MQVRGRLGNCLRQAIQQRHGVAAGNGEQQLEVLAVGERGEQRGLGGGAGLGGAAGLAADGDRGRVQLGADAAGGQDMAQVAGKAVADVEHGVHLEVLREPACFGQARLEFQVLAGQRAAQFARDEDGVAGLRRRSARCLSRAERSPSRATEMSVPPGLVVVSPPTMATPCCRARSFMPA